MEESLGLVSFGEGTRTWTEYDLEPILGELNNLEIDAIKVLGSEHPDYGDLTATIMKGMDIVAEKTAPTGTDRAFIKYSF